MPPSLFQLSSSFVNRTTKSLDFCCPETRIMFFFSLQQITTPAKTKKWLELLQSHLLENGQRQAQKTLMATAELWVSLANWPEYIQNSGCIPRQIGKHDKKSKEQMLARLCFVHQGDVNKRKFISKVCRKYACEIHISYSQYLLEFKSMSVPISWLQFIQNTTSQ